MYNTKKTFDSISSKYNLINNIISLGMHLKWKNNFTNLLEFNGSVLDVATGTGDIAIMVKKKYPNSDVIGLDPSEKMLQIANSRVTNEHKIKFVQGYCENIPFDDSYFDFITITFGIRNTKSIVDSLKEINRVLKKNGTFLIMEFSKNNNILVKFFYKIYLHLFIPFIGLLFGKFSEYNHLVSTIESFYTPEEMNKILEKNGFKVKRNIRYNLGLVTVYVANNVKF